MFRGAKQADRTLNMVGRRTEYKLGSRIYSSFTILACPGTENDARSISNTMDEATPYSILFPNGRTGMRLGPSSMLVMP
jgi:hypothetical protein